VKGLDIEEPRRKSENKNVKTLKVLSQLVVGSASSIYKHQKNIGTGSQLSHNSALCLIALAFSVL
jgi:hypothetical protein